MPRTQNVENLPARNNLDAGADTLLPHWGRVRTAIHLLCRRSRLFNHLISSIEMRMGLEEVVSLPQYIGLCPTGQCNAQCEFCAVTVQRTGIIKRQISLENIERFLEPSLNTVWMYGIEGNGEPTLYKRFDDLVALLTAHSAKAYLITNGSRLSNAHIPLLLKLENINFSLNAANAHTHNKVMKLEEFDAITSLIRDLIRARGDARNPRISASFVVTNDNIHEACDFLHFADGKLGVDEIFLRPLSELATETGAVEDLRDLVPLENDLREMINRLTVELSLNKHKAKVFFDPSTFHSYRAAPVEPAKVAGDAGAQAASGLKLPHQARWHQDSPAADISWKTPSQVTLRWDGSPGPYLLRSYTFPCATDQAFQLSIDIEVVSGVLGIGILDQSAEDWVHNFEFETGSHQATLEFHTGANKNIQVVLYSNGSAPLEAKIDWRDSIREAPTVTDPGTGKLSLGMSALSIIRRVVFGSTRYYCQKPWTDMSSFSVDGRVDVCCIATGPSQEQFSLGNFLTDNFQSLWNGERAREFRRTVNSGNQLPPCIRCPLHFAYQGPLLDPNWLVDGLRARLLPKSAKGSIADRIRNLVLLPVKFLIRTAFFRGFH